MFFLPISSGWQSAVCRRTIRLCDLGSGERDQISCGSLCAAGLGRQTPLPAAGGRLGRRLLCAASLCPGVHKVPPADASAGAGDVPRRRRSARPPLAGVGAAVDCEGKSGLFCPKEKTPHRPKCWLRHFADSVPCQNWASKIHAHCARLSARGQSTKIKPLCYFYR